MKLSASLWVLGSVMLSTFTNSNCAWATPALKRVFCRGQVPEVVNVWRQIVNNPPRRGFNIDTRVDIDDVMKIRKWTKDPRMMEFQRELMSGPAPGAGGRGLTILKNDDYRALYILLEAMRTNREYAPPAVLKRGFDWKWVPEWARKQYLAVGETLKTQFFFSFSAAPLLGDPKAHQLIREENAGNMPSPPPFHNMPKLEAKDSFLILKTCGTNSMARLIAPFSTHMGEWEALLLPGTEIQIENVETENLSYEEVSKRFWIRPSMKKDETMTIRRIYAKEVCTPLAGGPAMSPDTFGGNVERVMTLLKYMSSMGPDRVQLKAKLDQLLATKCPIQPSDSH